MENSRLIKTIDAAIRFFLYLLIFWLPYSTAVIESCVIIGFILWLIKRGVLLISQKRSGRMLMSIKPEATFLNRPIAFFLFACILSVTSSAFFVQSLHGFFTKTLEWFIIYFLVVEVFKDKRHIYIALAIFLFTTFSTAIDALIQFYITNKDIFLGHVIEPGSRATAGFKTPNGLGGYLTGVIPGLCAWIFLGKQKFTHRLIAFLVLLFTAWSLFVTFSRGAWTGMVFGGIFLTLFVLFPKGRLKAYSSLGFLWATILFCIAFLLILNNSTNEELLGRNASIQYRLSLWKDSILMVKDKLFFGHGINTFMRIFQAYRGDPFLGPTYAHNCYIQLAAETGTAGLLCFLWIIVKTFHQSLEKVKLTFVQDRNLGVLVVGLLSGIFAFLVHSFFDTNFYSLQLSAYLWLMVGILVSIDKLADAPKSRRDVFIGA